MTFKKNTLQLIDFGSGILWKCFTEILVLKWLVVPDFISEDEGDERQHPPITRSDLVFLLYYQPFDVNQTDDYRLYN